MRLILAMSMIFKIRGGIPRFNQMLCLALDRLAKSHDLDVTVLSMEDTDDDLRAAGSPWERLEFVPASGRLGIARDTLLRCMNDRPHGLLLGHIGMSPVGLACRPFLRRGYAVIAHGTDAWEVPRLSRRIAVRRCAMGIAVSEDTKQALARATDLDLARIRVLPNTLAPWFELAPPAESADFEDDSPEVLSVARLWAEQGKKGIDTTIRAVARLKDRHPALRYRIVGRGSDLTRLRALARDSGVADRVIFEQDLTDEELSERYRRCTLFALPSGQEGFGIVFLEAMRYSKPCIGGDTGGTPEVIEDGRTGILVPWGDVDALTISIDRIVSDIELRKRLGLAGRERLEREFLFERYVERLAEILREWIRLR